MIQSSGRDEQNWKLPFPKHTQQVVLQPRRTGQTSLTLLCFCARPPHVTPSSTTPELLVLGKQSLVDIRPGKLKLNSLHEMKFGLRNVPAAGVNTRSKRINSEAVKKKKKEGGRETRAPFYPFKLADLDDKGSCLIPLCASEYTKTNNPKENTRLAKKPARRCGVPSNLA